jgi:hypothetical protein
VGVCRRTPPWWCNGVQMTHDLTDWQKTVYDAVLWLTAELRRRDPNLPLPFYVSEIVMAAETARGNEKIVEGPGYDRPGE